MGRGTTTQLEQRILAPAQPRRPARQWQLRCLTLCQLELAWESATIQMAEFPQLLIEPVVGIHLPDIGQLAEMDLSVLIGAHLRRDAVDKKPMINIDFHRLVRPWLAVFAVHLDDELPGRVQELQRFEALGAVDLVDLEPLASADRHSQLRAEILDFRIDGHLQGRQPVGHHERVHELALRFELDPADTLDAADAVELGRRDAQGGVLEQC